MRYYIESLKHMQEYYGPGCEESIGGYVELKIKDENEKYFYLLKTEDSNNVCIYKSDTTVIDTLFDLYLAGDDTEFDIIIGSLNIIATGNSCPEIVQNALFDDYRYLYRVLSEFSCQDLKKERETIEINRYDDELAKEIIKRSILKNIGLI